VSVLIFEGMKVGILPGDFTIHVDDAGQTHSNLILSTSFNVLPLLLRIAHDNIFLSHQANKNVKDDWNDDPENQKILLIKELTVSMQVFIACGIALDSLYSQLKPFANLSHTEIETWKNNKTKRSAQIFQVIRRVYKLNNEISKAFNTNIDSIIDFRDKAVHPDNSIKRSCTRPDIPVGVDWRFSAYRYDNAAICYRRTMEMLIYLYEIKSKNTQVDGEMDYIFKSLTELGLISKNAQQSDAPEPLTRPGDL
jgi:hypothetical protein